jgi:hypothetical protein
MGMKFIASLSAIGFLGLGCAGVELPGEDVGDVETAEHALYGTTAAIATSGFCPGLWGGGLFGGDFWGGGLIGAPGFLGAPDLGGGAKQDLPVKQDMPAKQDLPVKQDMPVGIGPGLGVGLGGPLSIADAGGFGYPFAAVTPPFAGIGFPGWGGGYGAGLGCGGFYGLAGLPFGGVGAPVK